VVVSDAGAAGQTDCLIPDVGTAKKIHKKFIKDTPVIMRGNILLALRWE
jgi:hypothetical protein